MKRTQTILITTVMLSIALTSVFAVDFENTSIGDTIPFMAQASSQYDHKIVMEAVEMPDGLYAYRMVSYLNSTGQEIVGEMYSDKPSIPGPTIILTEGDVAKVTLINNACDDNFVNGPEHPLDPLFAPGLPQYNENSLVGIHVHGVHYDIKNDATYGRMNMNGDSGAQCNQAIDYEWVAAPGTTGAWPYHDHTFSINEIGGEELGLFGTVIVNPSSGPVRGLVTDSNSIGEVTVDQIDKDFVLWMVSTEVLGRSIFYGNEIDYDTTNYNGTENQVRETALWTNPNLITTEDGIYRIHVLGLGEETHAFHMHGHRWTEDISDNSGAFEDVIDVKEITPLQRHTFLIQASDNNAADDAIGENDSPPVEGWMYHCHFVDHMKQGMSGMMSVLPVGTSDDLPIIGAVFTLSDEPGLWMKTLDAGVADQLDNYLADTVGLDFKARNGTGFPLSYISDALDASAANGGTDFSNSEGRSLAVINPGETVLFGMKDSQTKHTITTLIYPEDAEPIGGNGILRAAELGHYDQQLGIRGSAILTESDGTPVGLDEPGLYVFVCKIHPYMFSAVIVDDPNTNLLLFGNENLPFPLLDLGENVTILTRAADDPSPDAFPDNFPATVPVTHPLATTLLKTFYIITDPNNWRDYQESNWKVSLPPVLVTTNTEDLVVGLAYDNVTTIGAAVALGLTNSTGGAPSTIDGLKLDSMVPNEDIDDDAEPGIGEVWVNTQFERTVSKNHEGTPFDKPGTITVVDVEDWSVERKISLPEIDMNHPHNMWTNLSNEVIYQTQWFGTDMAMIDRESGELIKEVFVGQSPSHVMTSPVTDKIYVAMNGEDSVNEFDPETYEMTRQISTGFRSHPHGHWVSSSGQYVVTPDFIGLKASVIDLDTDDVYPSSNILYGPIATGMKGDESVFYTADFLGNSMTAIDPYDGQILGHIDFLDHGLLGLPIQTPISPDDKWMVTALTLGGQIAVIDVDSSTPGNVKTFLDCDPGCHGVQWGAKEDGGYYAYVTSKFANVLRVVDPKDGHNAEIVAIVPLYDRETEIDDPVIGYDGMGGQGVLAIPNVYDGWIQNTVELCSAKGNDPGTCGKEVRNFIRGLDKDQKDP